VLGVSLQVRGGCSGSTARQAPGGLQRTATGVSARAVSSLGIMSLSLLPLRSLQGTRMRGHADQEPRVRGHAAQAVLQGSHPAG